MKYAKKMKLVEIDDRDIPMLTNNNNSIDDENYTKPRVLSSLDDIMNKILKIPDISDLEKWKLYSQALNRYLNHAKITSRNMTNNFSTPQLTEKDCDQKSFMADNTFNFTLPQFEMSGVEPIRDSIDSITQPIVKDFFQKARNSITHNNETANVRRSNTFADEMANVGIGDIQMMPLDPLMPPPPAPPQEQERSRAPQRRMNKNHQTSNMQLRSKRRAERSLSADISTIRPCKVLLSKLNWEPSTAR